MVFGRCSYLAVNPHLVLVRVVAETLFFSSVQ